MSTESASFIPLGAILQEFRVAGQNIVLGFNTQEQYDKYNSAHFGATIGRFANRTKDAIVRNVNGRDYTLATNDGPNHLHGGPKGWGKCVFDGPHNVTRNGKDALLFKYLSKDGEEGYPGTVELRVWYTESKEDVKTVLDIEYEVEFVGEECEETVINLTNHSYFNISDGPTIEGIQAQLATDNYLPVDSTGIPHGSVGKFPQDVTKPFKLGPNEPQIDDAFIVETDPSNFKLDTRNDPLRLNAQFSHPNGQHLEVHSTEPCFQFYMGKYIDIPEIDGNPARTKSAGFCVEPSRYVNAANEPAWKSQVLLKKGQIYGSKIVYKAWKA